MNQKSFINIIVIICICFILFIYQLKNNLSKSVSSSIENSLNSNNMKVLDALYQNNAANKNNDLKERKESQPESNEKLNIELLQWISELKLR